MLINKLDYIDSKQIVDLSTDILITIFVKCEVMYIFMY